MHGPIAFRTFADISVEYFHDPFPNRKPGIRISPGRCSCKTSDLCEAPLFAGVGEITTISDPAETLWEDVHKETSDEFFAGKTKFFVLSFITVILISDHNPIIGDRQDPAV
jgi:hypothetical protein